MSELTQEEKITIATYDKQALFWVTAHATKHFWQKEMDRFHELLPSGRILEIGAGGGRDARELIGHGYDYLGTDISSGLLVQARKNNPGAYFEQTSVYDLDYKDAFDGFWCSAVLLHIPREKIDEALTAIVQNMKPGAIGFITIKEGDGEGLEANYASTNGDERYFVYWSDAEFSKKLDDNELTVLERGYRPVNERTKWLTYIVRVDTHISPEALQAAQTLWNYHTLSMDVPQKADLLLVAGSHDTEVARRGAQLALDNDYRQIVISGGTGKVTAGLFKEPESVIFQRIFAKKGIEESRVLLETQATNSGENITLTRALLGEKAIAVGTGLLVTKPYMERRLLATATKQWPEVSWSVTSPALSLLDYLKTEEMVQRTIELMVGDLQRIELYAEKGFQTSQEIPAHVWAAFEVLVGLGYDAQVVKN